MRGINQDWKTKCETESIMSDKVFYNSKVFGNCFSWSKFYLNSTNIVREVFMKEIT